MLSSVSTKTKKQKLTSIFIYLLLNSHKCLACAFFSWPQIENIVFAVYRGLSQAVYKLRLDQQALIILLKLNGYSCVIAFTVD